MIFKYVHWENPNNLEIFVPVNIKILLPHSPWKMRRVWYVGCWSSELHWSHKLYSTFPKMPVVVQKMVPLGKDRGCTPSGYNRPEMSRLRGPATNHWPAEHPYSQLRPELFHWKQELLGNVRVRRCRLDQRDRLKVHVESPLWYRFLKHSALCGNLNTIITISITYARFLANPICNKVCNGVKFCLWFFVGVKL